MKLIDKKLALAKQVFFLSIIMLAIFSCRKGQLIGEDPYGGGLQPLGIKFSPDFPDPESALPNTEVNVLIRGLLKYKDQAKFYVNETEAEIVALTDSTARIKIPQTASSGGMSVVVNGQTFFGPLMQIEGKLMVDEDFQAAIGSNGPIFDILKLPSANYMLTGLFSNFDNKATEKVPIGGVVQINPNGTYATSLNFGKGADLSVQSVQRTTSGQYIIAGFFSSFNSSRPKRININSITRLNSDGTLDSMVVDLPNPTPNDIFKNQDTVPSFNGGVNGFVNKVFVYNDKIYAVGNFTRYVTVFYERSTYDTKVYDQVRMNQMVSMNMDGTLNTDFHYNASEKASPQAANGPIRDAVMLPDGKMVLVGAFTTFNGQPAQHIVRINLDGTVDNTFNGGTDKEIVHITYNQITNKLMIAGNYKTYNGAASNGVNMLELDGTATTTFNFGAFTGGSANYAGQLNNGKIIVSGNFKTYNGVVRQGFMLVEADGSLSAGNNNTGAFQGLISKITETVNGTGEPAVILVGSIQRFDNKPVNNIVRIKFLN